MCCLHCGSKLSGAADGGCTVSEGDSLRSRVENANRLALRSGADWLNAAALCLRIHLKYKLEYGNVLVSSVTTEFVVAIQSP